MLVFAASAADVAVAVAVVVVVVVGVCFFFVLVFAAKVKRAHSSRSLAQRDACQHIFSIVGRRSVVKRMTLRDNKAVPQICNG